MSESLSSPQPKILERTVRLLFDANATMIIGVGLGAIAYWSVARPTHGLVWLGYMMICMGYRMALQFSFSKSVGTRTNSQWRKLENIYAAGLLFSSAGWGYVGSVSLSDSEDHRTFLGFIVVTLIAGGASAYGISRKCLAAVTLPMVVPFAIYQLRTDHAQSMIIGAFSLIFLVTMIAAAEKRRSFMVTAWETIEEKERLLIEVAIARADAEQSLKLQAFAQMAGRVAHEVNTPLASISLNAEMLLESLETKTLFHEADKGCINDIEQSVKQIAEVVKSLKESA